MIPLIIIGALAVAAIALASGKAKGGAYNILIQSPAPIPSSAAMVATIMGFDPNSVNSASINGTGPGNMVLTIDFRTDYEPPLPKVNQTFNFNGVPGTIRVVQRAPVYTPISVLSKK